MPANTKRLSLLLFAAACLVYLYGAGTMPLVGPDEPRYAQVAREMFMRGDFVTPTLGSDTWFEKPALLYWMEMAAYRLFGINEWSARLPSALAGLLTIGAVAWLARRIERGAERAGGENLRGFALVSASVAASSLGLLVFSRGASFDVLITAATAWTLACFFGADSAVDDGERRRLLCGMYIGIGVGLLAKGLVGVVVPSLVIGSYYMLQRRLPARSLWLSIAWGVPLALIVAGVWYVPVMREHGWAFVDEFFIQHHFARYTSNKYRHPQPFFYYLPVMLLLAMPWALCLAAAFASVRKWEWRGEGEQDRLRVFALAWLVAPVLFFSISGSKLPGYVLPALPGATLLTAGWLTRHLRRSAAGSKEKTMLLDPRRVLRLTGCVLVLVACGGAIFAAYTGEVSIAVTTLIGLPVAAAGLFVWWRAGVTGEAVAAITVGTLLAVSLAAAIAASGVGENYSSRELLRHAAARGYLTEPLYGLYMFDRTAEFYAPQQVAYDAKGEPVIFDSVLEIVDLVRRLDAERGGRPAVLVFTFPYAMSHLTGNAALDAEVVGGGKYVALVRVRRR